MKHSKQVETILSIPWFSGLSGRTHNNVHGFKSSMVHNNKFVESNRNHLTKFQFPVEKLETCLSFSKDMIKYAMQLLNHLRCFGI